MKKSVLILWIFTLAIMLLLTLPTLLRDGMFMDALLYTSVSHNLSQGIGTFWFPQFSALNIGGLSSFHEQPPLVFGIQSLFFDIFGSSMFTERFYTFLMMVLTALMIHLLWRRIFHVNAIFHRTSWYPVLLWITVPVCFWSYSNNMHENTLGLFTLCAVYFLYSFLQRPGTSVGFLIISGIFIFLATFSKGIPGFFPVIFPILYWAINGQTKVRQALWYSLVLIVIPLGIYTIFATFPESRESLSNYLFKRALHRISAVPTVGNHFYIPGRLLMELLPQLLLTVILLIIMNVNNLKETIKQKKEALLFIATGFSASLPLMLTLVQKGFYFVPSLPFFAIGLAILTVPVVSRLEDKIQMHQRLFSLFRIFVIILVTLVVSFSISQIGKTNRNAILLADVQQMAGIIPRYSTVAVPPGLWNDWDLQCNLMRYYNISLDSRRLHTFFLTEKESEIKIPAGYKKINLPTGRYDLYCLKK